MFLSNAVTLPSILTDAALVVGKFDNVIGIVIAVAVGVFAVGYLISLLKRAL